MDLRFTDTNSANDSRGRAFGLEGNDFVFVLIAFVAALALYLVFAFVLRTSHAIALLFALPGLVVTVAWVLLLRRGKPDGYAADWFDQRANGEGWSFVASAQPPAHGKEPHA